MGAASAAPARAAPRRGRLGIVVRTVVAAAVQDVRVEPAGLDREKVEMTLLIALAQDILLDGMLADEAVDVHLARLTDPMAPVLGLGVHRRVPIRVVEDDGIGARQVHPHTSATRRQNEAEDLRVGVEPLHERLPHLGLGGAVETHVGVPVDIEECLQYIQHLAHLREDERPVASGLEPGEEGGQLLQLATVVLEQPLVGEEQLLPDTLGMQQGRRFGVLVPERLVLDDGVGEGRRVGNAGDELRPLGPGFGDDEDKLLERLRHFLRPAIRQLDHVPQDARRRGAGQRATVGRSGSGSGLAVGLEVLAHGFDLFAKMDGRCRVNDTHEGREPTSVRGGTPGERAASPGHAAEGLHPLHAPLSALQR